MGFQTACVQVRVHLEEHQLPFLHRLVNSVGLSKTTESKFAVTVPSQKVPAQIDKHSLCSDFATTSACIAFITITPSCNPCMTPFEYASSISLKRSYTEGILFYVLLPNFLALFNNWHCSHKPSIANVRYNIAMLQLHCSCKPFFSVWDMP